MRKYINKVYDSDDQIYTNVEAELTVLVLNEDEKKLLQDVLQEFINTCDLADSVEYYDIISLEENQRTRCIALDLLKDLDK